MPEPSCDGADLHLHTSFSDSTFTPEEVVRRAAAAGLSVIAVTDHDTVAGVHPACEAARSAKLTVAAGVEISSLHGNRKAHVIGLFIDVANPELLGELEMLRSRRLQRALAILRNLRDEGMSVEETEFSERFGDSTIGRPHIAQVLCDKGYASTLDEAYRRFIGDNASAYVPNLRVPAQRAIALIHAAGGVSVLAHPGRDFGDANLAELAEQGLDALEAWYPGYDRATTSHILRRCRTLDLAVSGGSDCHGLRSGEDGLIGTVHISLELVQKLKERRPEHALRQT